MKVLHLCPLWFPISHDSHGGIETLLAQLTPALAAHGCESTLVATGDSRGSTHILPAVPRGLCDEMEIGAAGEYTYYEQHQITVALRSAHEFDIIHSHVGAGAYVLSAIPEMRTRVLHTVHSPVLGDLQWFVSEHPGYWYSTVSEHQARKMRNAGATRCHAIHNGIDVGRFTFVEHASDELLFLGRMERVKGPDLAIRVATELGRPLTLAGPIVEPEFFERDIEPWLNDRIRYVGVVNHDGKNRLFGKAACAILPFRGEEPFGLVAIEAMACGTPVVALTLGALPEIVDPGVTGYLASSEDELSACVTQAAKLDRTAIRARVTERFDIKVTAAAYIDLYRAITGRNRGA